MELKYINGNPERPRCRSGFFLSGEGQGRVAAGLGQNDDAGASWCRPTSASPCALSRRSASPQASRDSDHKAMCRRVTVTSGLPRRAASQARRTATYSAFERPAICATACSQSKRTGPVVVGGKVTVRTERSRVGADMVGLPERETMSCCRQGRLAAAPCGGAGGRQPLAVGSRPTQRCGKTGVRGESPGAPSSVRCR